jgi:hypothetical protein
MNRKQFGILLVLLIVLGGAGWLVQKNRNHESGSGEQGAGQKLLGENFPINDVAHISIKQGTNELNLVKKDDLWRVRERNDYPANFSDISSFLLKARELKVVQVEQIGVSQLPRLELTPPGPATNSGVLLELKDKEEKNIRALTLGKKHVRKPQGAQAAQFGDAGYPDGRYVMLAGNNQNALLIGDPLGNVEAKPEQWLKKDFFKVERPKAIAVAFAETTNSWKLVRDTETGDWKFAEAKPEEKLDSTKASGVTSPFTAPSFNDVVALSAKPEDNGLDKPTVITVDTFDDFTYTVKVGRKSGDDYPITVTVAANFPKERTRAKEEKPEDMVQADKAFAERQKQLEEKLKAAKFFEQRTYLVPSYNIDPILKERKDLLVDKKEEAKPEAAAPEKN